MIPTKMPNIIISQNEIFSSTEATTSPSNRQKIKNLCVLIKYMAFPKVLILIKELYFQIILKSNYFLTIHSTF